MRIALPLCRARRDLAVLRPRQVVRISIRLLPKRASNLTGFRSRRSFSCAGCYHDRSLTTAATKRRVKFVAAIERLRSSLKPDTRSGRNTTRLGAVEELIGAKEAGDGHFLW